MPERGKIISKNTPKKTPGINSSLNTRTGYINDKKSENNTSFRNIPEKNINKSSISIIETPEKNNTLYGNNYIKSSRNEFNATEKPEEKESDNPIDNVLGPAPNV
jgi:hypothetical protein